MLDCGDDFCHANDPRSKGIVENLCGYTHRDLAVPLLTQGAVDGVALDLRSANTAAVAWCAEVNASVHTEIAAIPDERLIMERELLRPLPSLQMQIGAASVLRKVDRLSCVRYGSARYSVPTRRRSWSALPQSATPARARSWRSCSPWAQPTAPTHWLPHCTERWRFRRFHAADVRSILAAWMGAPQPCPAGDALVLELPVAPTISLDAYMITPVDGEATP